MTSPEFLKPGDKIGIISPAGKADKNKLNLAIEQLKNWRLEIIVGKYTFSEHHQFAGTDEQRINDVQEMLDNKKIKAIFCSRGGYGSIRIIEKLDFKNFIKNPKWIIGYSDITVFHAYINNLCKVKTIHGVMPGSFPEKENESILSLKNALFGELNNYNLPINKLNINGVAEGTLIGGNLSIIQSIIGSRFDYNTTDKILFIEDVDEYLYSIDRILMHLEISGKLNKLKGLIVGQFTEIKDNKSPFGMNAYEIIYEKIKKYDIPVSFGISCGHNKINHALIMGDKIKLEVNNEGGRLVFTT